MVRKNDFMNNVDAIAGRKIQELRIQMGLSRQQLAYDIDVTHQQLQKYEKGTNRISAGRLAAIAKTLNKPVSFFFDEAADADIPTNPRKRLCLEISRNVMNILDDNVLQGLRILTRSMIKK